MRNLVCTLTLLTVLLVAPAVFADALTKAQQTIVNEKAHFPEGDLDNIQYIIDIIEGMHNVDQLVRDTLIDQLTNPNVPSIMTEMDAFHTQKMKEIILHHGWPTTSKFSAKTDQQAWTLVQHADHDPLFQAGCLLILEQLVASGETDPVHYAYLYDRVASHFQLMGFKQKYGTQAILVDGEMTLLPYQGSLNDVNQRRQTIGLRPVEEYLQELQKIYIKGEQDVK